ncbi:Trehalose-phosphate phosphatase [Dorcoceras hygrometricum]|uniref:Trehalose-phosphate phosphatase n=1 Tax=Dorcoceras hygrometricum TaxID=472368 RepID=A0A2Z7ANF3_9LAMI|nr:Trehalose-phosphate phosphatase [Dorcoceras hygrometricum]
MHVAASSDHPRLPAFALYAPATMAGAPPAGPPTGTAGPSQTSLGPNHGPHSSKEASKIRHASRAARGCQSHFALPTTRLEFSLYGPPLALPRTPLDRAMVPRTCLNRSHA